MSTWAKYQLARKAIPDITWRLPLGYCQNPSEIVLSEGWNYKLFFVLLEANPILSMTPRDFCAGSLNEGLILRLIPPKCDISLALA